MNRLKVFAIVFCLVLAFGAFLPAARADEFDQQMKLNFNQPIEVPGVVLPAGTYWFVLADTSSDREVMQIFSEDWSTLYATLLTVPAYRQQAQDQPEVRLAERPHQKPEALLKLFYPGFDTGHEFLYHHKEEKELAHDAKLDIVVPPNGTPGTAVVPRS